MNRPQTIMISKTGNKVVEYLLTQMFQSYQQKIKHTKFFFHFRNFSLDI